MKTTKRKFPSDCRASALAGICFALGATAVSAADPSGTGLYFNADAGASLGQDINFSSIAAKLSTGPGLRLSLAAGYNFYSGNLLTAGAELETGLLYNPLSSVTVGGATAQLSGSYDQVPLLANLVLTFHPTPKWVPYIGFGGGAVVSASTINAPNGSQLIASETDGALQGMAGVRYKFTERSELGLGYKYLMAFVQGTDHVATHSVSLAYTLRF